MKPSRFFLLFLALASVITRAEKPETADDRKRIVSLIVFKDDSGSMNSHLRQVRVLADRLVAALQRSDCMELNLAVAAQSRFESKLPDNLVYGLVRLSDQEHSAWIDTGSDRFIRLRTAKDLDRFKARIVYGDATGLNEAAVAHVTDTIGKEAAFLRGSDTVAALIVSDVATGADAVKSEDAHLSHIRAILGKTPFVAFGIGMNPEAEKVSCMPDFPHACFEDMKARFSPRRERYDPETMAPPASTIDGETAFRTLQENGHSYAGLARSCAERYQLAPPDLLQKFTIKSGGKFADICAPKSAEIADQMAEAILKAAKCQFLM